MRSSEFINNKLLGPHEQKEISLMLSGKKPAALMGMTPEIKKLVKQGLIKAFRSTSHSAKQYFLTLPGEEDRAKKLDIAFAKLKDAAKNNTYNDINTAKTHIEIGKLLGYSLQAIKYFLRKNYPMHYQQLSKSLQS